jgi:serine/threonine protein kinase
MYTCRFYHLTVSTDYVCSIYTGGSVFLALAVHLGRRTYISIQQKNKLRNLPVHRAIIRKESAKSILDNVKKFPTNLTEPDAYGKDALDVAVDNDCDADILAAIVCECLPFDTTTGAPAEPSKHAYMWNRLVDKEAYVEAVEKVTEANVVYAMLLANALDASGRSAINHANPVCRNVILQSTYILKRFDVKNIAKPLHLSATCIIHLAIDHDAKDDESAEKVKTGSDPNYESGKTSYSAFSQDSEAGKKYRPHSLTATDPGCESKDDDVIGVPPSTSVGSDGAFIRQTTHKGYLGVHGYDDGGISRDSNFTIGSIEGKTMRIPAAVQEALERAGVHEAVAGVHEAVADVHEKVTGQVQEAVAGVKDAVEVVGEHGRAVGAHIDNHIRRAIGRQDSGVLMERFSNIHRFSKSQGVIHLVQDKKKRVALKFMTVKEQFMREVETRRRCQFDSEYVVDVYEAFDADEDEAFRLDIERRNLDDYPYLVVMPAGDKSLQNIIFTEHIAGIDWPKIKNIARQIAAALEHIHSRGYIHGDIKPLNIIRIEDSIRLIDLDASAQIDVDLAGAKYSSAYLPPEMIYECEDGSHVVKSYNESSSETSTRALSEKQVEYDYVRATASIDAWAFGVVLYELCSNEKLFFADSEDNLVSEYFPILKNFSDRFKRSKLMKIHKAKSTKRHHTTSNFDINADEHANLARNLVAQLLVSDPEKRPKMSQVLAHPFISGQFAPRMVGEQAEFDVFISYRVRSEKDIALALYEKLTAAGVDVWLDQMCLKPGEDWEKGFCDGLVKSRIFIPLLSRLAINDPENPRANFTQLTSDSPIDNMLLEQQLALEMYTRGLIEKIFPVMIGDKYTHKETGETMYTNYFASGCDANVKGDVIVDSVQNNLERELERLCLGTPLKHHTVASTKKEILINQGRFIENSLEKALEPILEDVKSMVKSASSPDSKDNFSRGSLSLMAKKASI